MQQYVCVPCTYVYDPEVGDIENGIYPDTILMICQMIGFAQFVALQKMNLSLLMNKKIKNSLWTVFLC